MWFFNTTLTYTWTHWGRVTHICVSRLNIIGSDNGLAPDRRQAIIWTNDGILSIWPSGTNISEMLSEIHAFSFKKMHFKMSYGKWRQCWLGLNVLTHPDQLVHICVRYAIIDLEHGLSPVCCQVKFSFTKISLKMAIMWSRPLCVKSFQFVERGFQACQGYPGYFRKPHWKWGSRRCPG